LRRNLLAAVGDCCVDDYADSTYVGGNALNVAVQWAASDQASAFYGAVGDDADGAAIRRGLRRAGVGCQGVQVLPGRTGRTVIQVDDRGDRAIVSEDLGVSNGFSPREADLRELRDARWVHAAALADLGTLAARLTDAGVPLSYDFSTDLHVRSPAPLAVAFYSFGTAPDTSVIDRLRGALAAGAAAAVGLCGAGGSVAVDHTETLVVPALDVTVVDTCGAGDSYIAAFTLDRMAGGSLLSSMHAGTRLAAQTCTHRGAWKSGLEPANSPAEH